jgi:tetratricopeptide (TPR) repeat protein
MGTGTPGDVAETVDLAAVGLPRLVFALLRQRFSGVVELVQPAPNAGPRSVWFQGGMPIFTDWVSPADSLGQILVDTGQITPEERDRAVLALRPAGPDPEASGPPALAAEATRERFGHYLVRRRLLTTAQLRKALRAQCARKLVHCFALRGGAATVTPGEAGPVDEHSLGAQVNALELIFAGVSAHYDLARVAAELGPAFAAPLRVRSSLARYRTHFHFTAADEAVLAAFAPNATIAAAAARSGQPALRVAQIAYTLHACQMLKPAAAAAETGGFPAVPSDMSEGTRTPARIGAGDLSPERLAEFGDELARVEAMIAAGAHAFDLLGLPRTAERPQVRAAWHALSRRFHPDALHHQELGHLRERSAAVFASLNEAYQILSDPAQREELAALLRAGGRPGAPAPTAQALLESEVAAREADKLMLAGNFDRALERWRRAAALSPDEPELQAAIAWCEHQRSPDKPALREATHAALQAAVARQPRCARARHYLGLLHLQAGDDEAALAAFASVLEIEPGHVDAQRQVHAIELRRKAGQEPPRRPRLFGGR